MGITSLQVCMDSSDWFQQGAISEEGSGMDSSPMTTPPGEDNILACSRPLIERRLRPQHEQALKCPRCESTHTKFCYYNNYSLSQPRYFCKTCRRYWTKGGTLRNIPVGGGCRKNKKVSSSNSKNKPSPSSSTSDHHAPSPSSLVQHNNVHAETSQFLSYGTHHSPTDLQLAFPEQLHFSGMFNGPNPGFLLENPAPIDFMENKYEALVGSHDYLGSGDQGAYGGINHGGLMADPNAANFYDFCSPYGMSSADHGSSSSSAAAGPTILQSCQRLMLPYDQNHSHHHFDQSSQDQVDVKPGTKIVSLDWHEHQQQACNSDAGYNFGGYGTWTGLMNGYGSSATNPLV